MEFHDTVMGKRFFDAQFPRLLQVLENISKSLSRETEPINIPVDIPENFLEDLYYGNLELGSVSREDYCNEKNKEIVELQEELKAQLTKEQWELFLKYSLLINDRDINECVRMFKHGYRTAIRLVLAGVK